MAADTEVGVPFGAVDFGRVLYAVEDIERVNPHRHEMRLLTAVVHVEEARHVVAGYADFSPAGFWVRGHFPNFPVVPGVLLCEAAAQLVNFYTVAYKKVPVNKLMGLGGLEEVRFRGMVRPGDRVAMITRGFRVSTRMTKFSVVGAVHRHGQFEPAFEAVVIGVPLMNLEDLPGA
jgi:3-hydroxyacyl-[acyl-carrier-protein] dehydratase